MSATDELPVLLLLCSLPSSASISSREVRSGHPRRARERSGHPSKGKTTGRPAESRAADQEHMRDVDGRPRANGEIRISVRRKRVRGGAPTHHQNVGTSQPARRRVAWIARPGAAGTHRDRGEEAPTTTRHQPQAAGPLFITIIFRAAGPRPTGSTSTEARPPRQQQAPARAGCPRIA